MDNLSDVCSCLRALDSSKATDRKKNATRLQQLLDTNSVKKVLDQNAGEQRTITWDVILKGVNKYINIEMSSLKTAKESQSTSTLASRDKRKHELADLFKFVVRAANERGARLSASLLIDSILEILNDDFTLGALGADYSSILLKSVLQVRAYWLKLSPPLWRKLLHIYCKLFEEEAFDTDIVVRIIKELVNGNIQQGELNPKRLFSFFSRRMEQISNMRAPSVLENLLMSLNTFCVSVAPGCRAQLCGFGESQMKAFTTIWENASTKKIKSELIQFFQLLVKAHHPKGVSKPGEGAFAVDWSLWQSQLLILHELIVSDIDMSAASYKIISGSKDSGLHAHYINLAADIFKQLPVSKIVPVSPDWSLTQATQFTGQVGEGAAETPAKRQRLAPEKKSLLELIKEYSCTLQAVPWLQILRQLLEQYPQVFDEDRLNLTMELLINMLGRCKKGRLYQHLFGALSALISALHQHGLISRRQTQLMASLWSHCLSTINSRQAGVEGYQEQGFSVMATVINCGYIQPRPEIWNLFLPGLCRPCAAATSLLTALICQRLPENHVPSIVGTSLSSTGKSETRSAYPLRKSLIRWLVPLQDEVDGLGETCRVTDLNPKEVAETLYALTLQDLTVILKKKKCWEKTDFGVGPHHYLEALYLDNLFETSDKANNSVAIKSFPSLEENLDKDSRQHGPHIPLVLEYLRKYLHQISRQLESLEPKVQSLECLSWFSCMLAKLVCLLVSNSVNKNPEVQTEEGCDSTHSGPNCPSINPLQKILCSVIEKCAALFVSYVKKENGTGLGPTFGHLCSMLDWNLESSQLASKAAMFHTAQVVRSALPASFVDTLVDIVSGKSVSSEAKISKGRYGMNRKQSSNSELRNSSHRSEIMDLDMFDLFDNGFNGEASSRSNANSELDEEMDLGITAGSSSSESLRDNKDFLCESLLTENQHIQLGSLRLLSYLTSFDVRARQLEAEFVASLGVGMDMEHVKSKMLQRVSVDYFDPASSIDIHMLLTLTELLLTNSHHVTHADVKALFKAIKQAAKELQKDQQVCCRLVGCLRSVVPHLKGPEDQQRDSPPAEELALCRDFFFKIVSSFWQLACDGTPPLKLKVAELFLDLIKFDPDCSWGQLKVEGNDNRDRHDDSPDFSLCTVKKLFHRILLETNLQVRAFVAHSLSWLFVSSMPVNKKYQIKVFDEVFMLSSELLNVEEGVTLHLQDELSNGQGIFLHVLLTIIKCSTVCEKPCLLGLFQMMADRHISIQLVSKMLDQACTQLDYTSVEQYLAAHLPYLVYNWLHVDMVSSPLGEFPFQLLGYKDVAAFTKAYPSLIISMLLATKLELTEVQDILTHAALDVHSTLLAALPDILVHILPQFAAKAALDHPSSQKEGRASSQQGQHKQFQAANKCFAALKKVLSEQEINERVCEMLGVIVVKVLSCLHMGSVSESMVYPEPNPPNYTEDKIILTLDYIALNFNDDNGESQFSLASVLAKIPNGLHEVFLSISSQLWKEHHAYEQNRGLHMMGIFVRLVLKEMKPVGGGNNSVVSGSASRGIVRDILNRLLVILHSRVKKQTKATVTSPSYEEDVIISCLKILHDVCRSVLENCPHELVQFMQCIVDTVANVAGVSEAAGQVALQVLLTLTGQGLQELNCYPRQLQEALSLLNPLPPVPVLAELRVLLSRRCNSRTRSLAQLLDDFLTVSELAYRCSFQGLALRLEHLSKCITGNQTEIQNLISSPKGLKQMRDVIQQLSSLCTSSSQDVAIAAASCLGAIGPINLQVLSLKFHQSSKKDLYQEDNKTQEFEKYHWLFQALDACLLDESLEVVSTTSKILQHIMTTESSKQFEKHYVKLTRGQGSLFRYLQPFKNSPQDLLKPDHLPSEAFSIMSRRDLWLGEPGGSTEDVNQSHEVWIKALVKALLSTGVVKDEVLVKIGPLCALKGDFCESSLPYLIHEALIGGTQDCKEILSQQFASFFHLHVQQQQNSPLLSTDKYSLLMNKRSIRTMLAVVQYLRTQKRPQQSRGEAATAWHNNLWLDLNYLDVAQAAQFCGASFSAVLYTEIYWGIRRQAQEHQQSQQFSSSSARSSQNQRSQSSFGSPKETAKCENLLMEAYKTIGDPDGIYGYGAGKQANIMTRVETYMHELQHEKALITLDIAMCNDPTLNMTHLLQAVQSCGADYILQQCLPQMQSQMGNSSPVPVGSWQQEKCGDRLDDLYYQAAWKLGQWDIYLPHGQERQSSFHESVYKCLHCIKDDHLDTGFDSLLSARLNVIHSFDTKAETCSQLYPFLSQLQCLSYLDQVVQRLKNHSNGSFPMDHTITSYHTEDFPYQEALLQLMSATGRVLESRGLRHGQAVEVKALWDLALGGRKANHFQVSERALQTLRLKHSTSGSSTGFSQHQLHLEEAKLFWARAEVNMAMDILHNLIQSHKQASSSSQSQQNVESERYLQSLVLYGNWLAETKSETPSVIMDFYQTAVNTIKSKTDGSTSDQTALQAFVSVATYADEQYQLIVDYMQSPVYEEKCRLVRQSKCEVEEYQKLQVQTRVTVKIIERNFKIDEQEVAALQRDRDQFLRRALDGYLQCLVRGNSHDLRISRVLALWFDNSDTDAINSMIGDYVPQLLSHKFLLLFYQLAARMGSSDDGFNSTLTKLLERVAVEHPHHSLWVVLALAHAHKDSEFTAGGKDQRKGGRRDSTGDAIIEEKRVQAAKDLLDHVSRTKSQRPGVHLDQVVDGMRRFSLACIQLANMPVDKKGGSQAYTIPSSQAIVKLQNLEHVQVPIVELAIDPTGSYTDLVSLVKFERTFRTAGGINLPKIISLVGSDGVKRTSLVKGRDDLRQDAVMQQVFSLVNQLLAADQETRLRQLSIRTYKVVPLSQNSGLLQWCEGTIPLGDYLAARQGNAHSRYNPLDWKVADCQRHLHEAGSQPDKRFKAYQEICAHFHPVFRHFFMEKYVKPEEWFECRLAYTRSVATNSIVGYILGLGDRHVNNILIDLKTAELVHIDFGIAFEGGRILPTPETVPFRLTRDIVDGMGIPGVEGVFRRCCEKMMQVMKNNSESLLTIVQVLLHDPLSHWSPTPDEILALERKREQAATDTVDVTLSGQVPSSGVVSQSGKPPTSSGDPDAGNNNETKEKRNKMAKRTLLRLRQKLRGEEDSVPLSVSGQVNLLIQRATDPQNLCRLFVGWQAYL